MAFVTTAEFVITQIESAKKLADRVFFINSPVLFFGKTYAVGIY